MADKTETPLLSLDTLVERYHILIDGTRYELVNSGELSILDYHRIARQGARVQQMMDQDEDLGDDQVKELSRLLDALCRVILLAPEDIHARLTDNDKLAVITAFTQLQRGKTAPPAGDVAAAPEAPSTGESSSPA